MKMAASAWKGRSVSDAVRKLTITASDEKDAEDLAILNAAIYHGTIGLVWEDIEKGVRAIRKEADA